MRLYPLFAVAALGAVLAAPAQAQEKRIDPLKRVDPFGQLDVLMGSGALVRGVVNEDDVTLLFDHLRASILAASQGREAPPPPEALGKRAEEIATEVKVRGTAASLILLNAFEGVARQVVRDLLAAPPSVSSPTPR
jgi:hypothetical protein